MCRQAETSARNRLRPISRSRSQLFKDDGTAFSGEAHVTMNAGRTVYFGRAQDYGLREDSVLTVNPNNSLSLTAWAGDIFLLPGGQQSLQRTYPATFSARAEQGSIIVRAGEQPLAFWPSPTGRITFYAKNEIRGEGIPQTVLDLNSVLFFTGIPGDQAAKWVRIGPNCSTGRSQSGKVVWSLRRCKSGRPWGRNYADRRASGSAAPCAETDRDHQGQLFGCQTLPGRSHGTGTDSP